MSEETNILTKKKFLSEKEVLESIEKRKDEWYNVKEKDESANEKPENVKTLFQQLEANRNKMIDDFEEHFKLINHCYKGLTDEERAFMLKLKQFNHKKETEEEERIKEELKKFEANIAKTRNQTQTEERDASFDIIPLKHVYKPKKTNLIKVGKAKKVSISPVKQQSGLVSYGDESDSE